MSGDEATEKGVGGSLVDRVFGGALDSEDSDSEVAAPKRPKRRNVDSDDDDDEESSDSRKPSAGSKLKPKSQKRKGRLNRRGASDDDSAGQDEDDPNRSDDDIRPAAAARPKSKRLAGESSASLGSRKRSAVDDIEDDDFIDDAGAEPRKDDDDDVIATEGGFHVSSDIEDDGGEVEEEEKYKSEFDKGLERLKGKRRKRRKDLDPADVDADVVSFLSKMMQAREEDIELYESGQPALNKLRMIPEVKRMFIRHEYREAFLDRMVLAVFKCWLEPMADAALPNIEIRSTLLDILSGFRVDSSWVERLENSQGLGRIINYLSVKDEHPPNQLAAKKLLKAWSRPFYNANNDFHDLRDDFEHNSGVVESHREARRNLAKLTQRNQKRVDLLKSTVGHAEGSEPTQVVASIPEKTPFLFTKMAESSVEGRVTKNKNAKRGGIGGGSSALSKRFNQLKRKRGQKSGVRGPLPSINGRD